jgi:hypothetical protein
VSYWSAKSDLAFMLRFRADVFELYEHEAKAAKELHERGGYIAGHEWQDAIKYVANENDTAGYQAVRQRLAVGMSRAVRVGHQLGIPTDLQSYPAPAIGGPIIPVNVFEATLNDPSHGSGLDKQLIIDTLNRTLGEADEKVRDERRHALNPAWWLWSLASFILRIPFILISATGLRVAKFEAGAGGIILKVVEAVAIAYVLVKLGLQKGS